MKCTQDLLTELQQRVQNFHRELEPKVMGLSREGLLMPNDKAKLDIMAKHTVEALSQSEKNTSYKDIVKEELLLNLVKSYERDVVQQIHEIESRRYTDQFLRARIERTKQRAVAEMSSSTRERRIELELSKIEKQLWEDIHGISKKVSRRPAMLDLLLHEFERDIQSLLRSQIGSARGEG